jgi:hypothetical protein
MAVSAKSGHRIDNQKLIIKLFCALDGIQSRPPRLHLQSLAQANPLDRVLGYSSVSLCVSIDNESFCSIFYVFTDPNKL